MPTQITQVNINGVSVSSLNEVIEQVRKQTDLGLCRFRATNHWIDGAHNQATIKDFYAAGGEDTSRTETYVIDSDEPPLLAGANRGANPVEFVLTGLSGCLTTTLVYYAARKGIKLEAVKSALEGELDIRGLLNIDGGVRNGFRKVRVTFDIESAAPREQIEELVELAQRFSPVCDIISNPVPVVVQLAK